KGSSSISSDISSSTDHTPTRAPKNVATSEASQTSFSQTIHHPPPRTSCMCQEYESYVPPNVSLSRGYASTPSEPPGFALARPGLGVPLECDPGLYRSGTNGALRRSVSASQLQRASWIPQPAAADVTDPCGRRFRQSRRSLRSGPSAFYDGSGRTGNGGNEEHADFLSDGPNKL
ncbi:F-box/LRR-repeat protein 7, partial [Takifugu flavidus]